MVTFAELASHLEDAASNQHQTPLYGNLPGNQGGSFLFAVDSPGNIPKPEPKQTQVAGRPESRGRQTETGHEPPGRPPKPAQTYRVRQGAPQTLEELGVTASVSFTTVEALPVATLIVSFPAGTGRQPAFEAGTPLNFEVDGLTLQGTVLEIGWDLKEIAFTLGRAQGGNGP